MMGRYMICRTRCSWTCFARWNSSRVCFQAIKKCRVDSCLPERRVAIQMMEEPMYTVVVVADRPDFRCFLDLLFGPGRNVDTEGDSYPVNSRSWTLLHMKDRESDAPSVEIYASEVDESRFKVQSESSRLEELAALYLYLTCGETISNSDQALDKAVIESLCKRYDAELGRARDSIWHRSTDDLPYPHE